MNILELLKLQKLNKKNERNSPERIFKKSRSCFKFKMVAINFEAAFLKRHERDRTAWKKKEL